MAEFGRIMARTARAAGDLRTKQYVVLRSAGAGLTNQASNAAGGVDGQGGVLLNKPNSGQAASVGWNGETKVKAGGTVTANVWQSANSSGHIVDASSGDWAIGVALEAATSNGEVVRMLLQVPPVYLPNSLHVT